jgi:hypothetical protein
VRRRAARRASTQPHEVLRQHAYPQLPERDGRGLVLGCASGDQFPPSIVEMLGQFLDNLGLARRRQAQ